MRSKESFTDIGDFMNEFNYVSRRFNSTELVAWLSYMADVIEKVKPAENETIVQRAYKKYE